MMAREQNRIYWQTRTVDGNVNKSDWLVKHKGNLSWKSDHLHQPYTHDKGIKLTNRKYMKKQKHENNYTLSAYVGNGTVVDTRTRCGPMNMFDGFWNNFYSSILEPFFFFSFQLLSDCWPCVCIAEI